MSIVLLLASLNTGPNVAPLSLLDIMTGSALVDATCNSNSSFDRQYPILYNHSTRSTDVNVSIENFDSSSDDVSNNSSNETVKLEDNHIDGDVGDDGIDDSKDENNDNKITNLDSRTKSDASHLSSHHDDIHLENDETDQSLTNTNNQMRIATTGSPTYTHTNNLSHLSHLSHSRQPTKEKISEFFYDDPEIPYRPPPSHNLDESPCESIIRIDNHSLYYCTLHPDVRSYHLDSIEHHIKYKNGELHKSEILRLLDICQHVK